MEAGTDPHRRLTSCSLPLSLKRDPHARIPCRGRRPRRPATPCFPPRLPSKRFRFSCISSLAMGEFHMPSAYFTREAHFTRRRRISLRRNTRRHGRSVRRAKSTAAGGFHCDVIHVAMGDPPLRFYRHISKETPTPGSPVGVGALDDPLRLAFRRASPQSVFAFSVFPLSPWANFICLRHISRAKRISPAAGGFHCGVIHVAMGDPCDAQNHPLATPEHPIPTQIFILCEYAKILSIDSPPIF